MSSRTGSVMTWPDGSGVSHLARGSGWSPFLVSHFTSTIALSAPQDCLWQARRLFPCAVWPSADAKSALSRNSLESDQIHLSVSKGKIRSMLCSITDASACRAIKHPRAPSRASRRHAQLLLQPAPLHLRPVHPTELHPRLSSRSGIPQLPGSLPSAQRPVWRCPGYSDRPTEAFFAKYAHHQ